MATSEDRPWPPARTPTWPLTIVRSVLFGVAAALVLLVGTFLIYAFGAGHFGYFAVPSPANFVVGDLAFQGA